MAYFKNIKISNFRNFKEFNLDFSNKCNVFYGSNGSGKTNILEAISIFSKDRGLRKDKIFNLIKKNEDFFSNDAKFIDENVEYELNAFSENKNNKFKKKIKLNGEISSEVNKKIQSLITFLIYIPENERLFMSSPTTRRNLFDHFIFSNNPQHNRLLNFYKKNIIERNIILNNNLIDQSWLEKVEADIAKSGMEIYAQRIKQSEIFEKNIEHINEFLKTPFRVNIEINDLFFKSKTTTDDFKYNLKKNREIDKIIGGTKIGPHKSDIIIYIDQNYPASQLSTGQQKTLVLLLYFAQCNYLVNYCKKKPILLLDEINSHLDDFNIQLLLKIIEQFEIQVFMTGTKKDLFSFLSTNTNFYNISKK